MMKMSAMIMKYINNGASRERIHYVPRLIPFAMFFLTVLEQHLLVDAFTSPTKCVSHGSHQHKAFHLAPQQLGEFKPINLIHNENDEAIEIDQSTRRVWLYDFVSSNQETVPYQEAWDLQKRLMEQQLARIGKRPKDPPLHNQFVPLDVDEREHIDRITSLQGCDSIIMLQHDPVYTLGTASDTSFIHDYDNDNEDHKSRVPIVRIERGGEVTYHGPGQLTVYPILDLRGYNQDIHWYMRALEEATLLALKKAGVIGATREDDLTGVWVSDKKIAACGVKLKRWVTMHGVAINVDIRSLEKFEGIVPCGLEGREVTCINDVIDGDRNSYTLKEFAAHMKAALEEIFGITLMAASAETLCT